MMDGPRQHTVAWLALIVAIIAGIIAYRSAEQQRGESDRLRAELATVRAQLDEQSRLVRLATEISSLARSDDAASSDASVSGALNGESTASPIELANSILNQEAAIDELRTEVFDLQQEMERTLPDVRIAARAARNMVATSAFVIQNQTPSVDEIPALEADLLSRKSSLEEKLTILRQLRSADARSDDVARHMAAQYYQTDHEGARADIFRQLDGVVTPELRTALLDAVANDEGANVREEAAETLEHFLPDKDVQEWLEYLAANDPNAGVRTQASSSLDRFNQLQPQQILFIEIQP